MLAILCVRCSYLARQCEDADFLDSAYRLLSCCFVVVEGAIGNGVVLTVQSRGFVLASFLSFLFDLGHRT